MKPAISIITATFNHGVYLQNAIESLREQTFTNWEHIVVDDHSSDTTETLCRSQNDPRLRYFRNSENMGQAESLNLGLREAQADIVGFLDADDTLKVDHLDFLTKELSGLELDFLLARFEVQKIDPEVSTTVLDFYNPGKTISVYDIECITGCLFGKKKCFIEAGLFRKKIACDTEMFNSLKRLGFKWKRAGRPTYNYCLRNTMTSESQLQMAKWTQK